MGLEARCPVTWQGKTWTAGVHLDSLSLQVRGRPPLNVPLASVTQVTRAADRLELQTAEGTLSLSLGDACEKWALKIASPPSRSKKLGMAPGVRVSLVALEDAELERELADAGALRVSSRAAADLVFFGVNAARDLDRLPALRARIEPHGALWVVRAKGKAATVDEGEVRRRARDAGLVDVKVVSFSDTQSADKFVVPARDRPKKASPPKASQSPRSKSKRG
jgi:hypothetical protein